MKKLTNLALALATLFAFHVSSLAQNTFPSTGNVGIGTTTTTNSALNVVASGQSGVVSTVTNTGSGWFQGVGAQLTQNAANPSGAGIWGITNFVVTGHPSGTNVNLLIPSMNVVEHAAAGTMTEGRAVQGEILMGQTAGNMNDAMCFYATSSIINGTTSSGTIGSGYGFYLAPFSSNFVNKYGFYINDATANNYLAGTMSIGTTSTQGYSLAVNGKAIFTKAVVKLFANWPDYVFKTDYRLPSLGSLKTYIRTNGHLPEMPTAAEVSEKGIDLGANQALLLKKVEEMTLYIIHQDEKLTSQQEEIETLKRQMKDLSLKAK